MELLLSRRDDGQAAAFLASLSALAMLAVLVLGHLAVAGVEAARARAAADAVALEALAGGEAAAVALAAEHRAVLVSLQRRGDGVEVVVRVGKATATARAEWAVEGSDGTSWLVEGAASSP